MRRWVPWLMRFIRKRHTKSSTPTSYHCIAFAHKFAKGSFAPMDNHCSISPCKYYSFSLPKEKNHAAVPNRHTVYFPMEIDEEPQTLSYRRDHERHFHLLNCCQRWYLSTVETLLMMLFIIAKGNTETPFHRTIMLVQVGKNSAYILNLEFCSAETFK